MSEFGKYIKIEKNDTSAMLENFIHCYNADLQSAEGNEDQIEALEAKLAQSYAEFDQQKAVSSELQAELKQVSSDYHATKPMLKLAEENSHKQIATQKELLLSKLTVADLQKELSSLKGGENPKKMREQIKRIKEKSISDKKRLTTAENAMKLSKRATEKLIKQLQEKDQAIYQLQKELSHNNGSGLYHHGDHHLIIWPEKTRVQRPGGDVFEGRALLYMHQSGRGGLITYDPTDNQSYLCKAPKTGLRPSKDVREFAKNWLYNVNELQDGIVKDKDMLAVNYNSPDSEPAVNLAEKESL